MVGPYDHFFNSGSGDSGEESSMSARRAGVLPSQAITYQPSGSRQRGSTLANNTDLPTAPGWETYQGPFASRYPPLNQAHAETRPFDLGLYEFGCETYMTGSAYTYGNGFGTQSIQGAYGGAGNNMGSSSSMMMGYGQSQSQGILSAQFSNPSHFPASSDFSGGVRIADSRRVQSSNVASDPYQYFQNHPTLTWSQKMEILGAASHMARPQGNAAAWARREALERNVDDSLTLLAARTELATYFSANPPPGGVLPFESTAEAYGLMGGGADNYAHNPATMREYQQLVEEANRLANREYGDDDQVEEMTNQSTGNSDTTRALVLRPDEDGQGDNHQGYAGGYIANEEGSVNNQAHHSSSTDKGSPASSSVYSTAPDSLHSACASPSTYRFLSNAYEVTALEPEELDLARPGQIEHSEESGGVRLYYRPVRKTTDPVPQTPPSQPAQRLRGYPDLALSAACSDDVFVSNSPRAPGRWGTLNAGGMLGIQATVERGRPSRSVPWNKANEWSNGDEEWA